MRFTCVHHTHMQLHIESLRYNVSFCGFVCMGSDVLENLCLAGTCTVTLPLLLHVLVFIM